MRIPWTKEAKRNLARIRLITHIRRTRNLAAVAKSEAECGDGDLACLIAERVKAMVREGYELQSAYAKLCPRKSLLIASE